MLTTAQVSAGELGRHVQSTWLGARLSDSNGANLRNPNASSRLGANGSRSFSSIGPGTRWDPLATVWGSILREWVSGVLVTECPRPQLHSVRAVVWYVLKVRPSTAPVSERRRKWFSPRAVRSRHHASACQPFELPPRRPPSVTTNPALAKTSLFLNSYTRRRGSYGALPSVDSSSGARRWAITGLLKRESCSVTTTLNEIEVS